MPPVEWELARDAADRSRDRCDRHGSPDGDRGGPGHEQHGTSPDRSREPRPVDLSAPHTRSAVRPDAEAEGTEPSEVVEVLRDALIRLRVPEVRDSFGDGVEVEIQGSPDHAAAAVADRVAEDVKTGDLSIVELHEDLFARHPGDHSI